MISDAIVYWEPRKEGPVNLSEVKEWIINLRRQGFNIGLVTFDRWNSFDIQRDLKSVGMNTETLSVAKKHYEDLSMLIYEERVVLPQIDLLLEEMTELRIMNNNRVDHPRKKSKDLADAMCGSVYNAISHTRRERNQEIEIHTYETRSRVDKLPTEVVKSKPEMTPEVKDFLESFHLL